MAAKRKAVDTDSVQSLKKLRIVEDGIPDGDVLDEAYASDGSEDYITNFTDNGTRRAESEARRQWNYVCEFKGCGQRFNRPCRLEAHIRTHTKERPFACPHHGCDKDFPRKDHLQRHLKNAHNGEVERTFACDWPGCEKTFTSNGRLKRHREVHESKFYCTGHSPCNEVFRKEKALMAHIKSAHLEVKPFACTHVDEETGERCSNGYQSEGALRRHVAKAHAGSQEDRHFCMICIPPESETETIQTAEGNIVTIPKEPLSFSSYDELQAHSQEVHPPVCSECGLKCKTQAILKAHFDAMHADPEKRQQFPCPEPGCDSIFTRKSNLNVHIQCVHEQKARFTCSSEGLETSKHEDLKNWNGENACGASFKSKSSLEQHIRTHHLGLENRKTRRKIAKSRKKQHDPSTLTLLTGVGYEQGRHVPCLIAGCEFRFFMDRDLRRHLRSSVHNLSEEAVEEMIRDRDAISGGQFWIGGLDENDISMFDSAEPSVPHTPGPYFVDSAFPTQYGGPEYGKGATVEQQNELYEQLNEYAYMQDQADLDAAMGLDHLGPHVDVHDGLAMDVLGQVEDYNFQAMQG
ncbi:hypothetical protein BS50DRAFT_547776 [Corynespora cassiicola Philippines]|uniref:C2H2-type domain-containing protein n=1 Tax=Corynespora cassiicola Philippines TaxID=1448308 RepID=A0A2T2NXH1_CORCC|nr:hypothetical protein BS50DRAFT_547776 [Corynespora cassiicola Philippines]